SFYLAFSPLPERGRRLSGGVLSVPRPVTARFRPQPARVFRGLLPGGGRTFLRRAKARAVVRRPGQQIRPRPVERKPPTRGGARPPAASVGGLALREGGRSAPRFRFRGGRDADADADRLHLPIGQPGVDAGAGGGLGDGADDLPRFVAGDAV